MTEMIWANHRFGENKGVIHQAVEADLQVLASVWALLEGGLTAIIEQVSCTDTAMLAVSNDRGFQQVETEEVCDLMCFGILPAY
jgi:hypothetical protein